jgi:protein-L-isoaspartate(D-aspartate) O-methyltransferase
MGFGFRILRGARFVAPLLFFAAFAQGSSEDPRFAARREEMVRLDIEGRGVRDPKVLQVMREIPRHLFVPEKLKEVAYGDRPLPIGEGQTISQPYVVAYMTEALRLKGGEKVLEIGTGSGYQAAVLAKIAKEVCTMEIRGNLAAAAAARLREMHYPNVSVKHADGYFGWPEKGPFDAIMITAAANHIPPPLLKQLKEGGRLILPLGSTFYYQTLVQVTKRGEKFDTERLIDVRFVPMTGEAEKKQ